MLLNLDEIPIPMKRVYLLSKELKNNQERVDLTQELTLDITRPLLGLNGKYGLFGSDEWWNSIRDRKMPLLFLSGTIQRTYVAGQDESDLNNTVDILLEDGSVNSIGIYTNNIDDVSLFNIGCRVEVVYGLDELKKQPAPDGGVNYSKVALEMAISEDEI